ncbi:cytochrome c oxidase assembly protein [Micromonospora sp. NPDC002717]|uniref:cytochrome c oxidase assembly protein n=1 Tax=Micromonospora sp. NPDC002717 TaxID=3154424 RepID=UPI003322E868
MTATGGVPQEASVVAGLLDILLVLTLALLAAGYGRGVHELWARRGAGRVLPGWRVGTFGLGVLVALAAQGPPLTDLAGRSLTGHMIQHMALLLVAGPLLAAGAAGLPLTLACPQPLRQRLARLRAAPTARWLRRPVTTAALAGGVQTLVLWVWHLPGPYVAALQQPLVHAVEHLCFVTAAWLLWAPVLGAPQHRLPAPIAVLLLVATMLPASALGAVLTFAPRPVYPAEALGPNPLTDQQVAGLLMWAPMDVVVLVATLTIFLRWLLRLHRQSPDRVTPPEQSGPVVTTHTGAGAR